MQDEKLPQMPETYDTMFRDGGDRGVFKKPYRHSCYYPMFKCIERDLRRRGLRNVLEIGCGTGAFAHLLLDAGGYSYRGFDFSSEAVRQAEERTGRKDLFYVADATQRASYEIAFEYDAIVCTEVLEHVPGDLDVIANWPRGKAVIATVPNFDSQYHVRYFKNEGEVRFRYGEALLIDRVVSVKKPYLADISPSNYWRELRWARYRPKQMAKILGFGAPEDVGCWFIMEGKSR